METQLLKPTDFSTCTETQGNTDPQTHPIKKRTRLIGWQISFFCLNDFTCSFFLKSERSLERTECNNQYSNQNPSCRDTSMPSSQRPTEPFASCTFSSRYNFFFFFFFAYCRSNPRDLFSLLLPLSSPTFYIKRKGRAGVEGGVSMETNHYNKCTTIWIFLSKPNENKFMRRREGFMHIGEVHKAYDD